MRGRRAHAPGHPARRRRRRRLLSRRMTGGRLEVEEANARFYRAFEALDLAEMEKVRSEEHTSELQSRGHLVCRLLLEKKKNQKKPRNDVWDKLRSPDGASATKFIADPPISRCTFLPVIERDFTTRLICPQTT